MRLCDFDGCGRTSEHMRRGYCPTHYNQLRKGHTLKPIGIKVSWTAEKALAEAVKSGDCLLFRPHLKKYPVVRVGKVNYLAHRFVYEGFHGPLPAGSHVHHKCANAHCVNPDHLERAAAADNTLEMLARRDYEAEIARLQLRIVELEARLDMERRVV